MARCIGSGKAGASTVSAVAIRDSFLLAVDLKLLATLQHEQVQHDAGYHADIYRMPLEGRVRHLVFHFAKYVGRLVDCHSDHDPVLRATLIDTFVIALSTRGALGISADGSLHPGAGKNLLPMVDSARPVTDFILLNLARETGHMAKACEGYDHKENLEYVEIWKRGADNILLASMSALKSLNADIPSAVRTRWRNVESNHVM
jgi:hypothetical protein